MAYTPYNWQPMTMAQPQKKETDWAGNIIGGAASGAAAGSTVAPGWGTVIGGVLGAGEGVLTSVLGDKDAEKKQRQDMEEYARQKADRAKAEAEDKRRYEADQLMQNKQQGYGVIKDMYARYGDNAADARMQAFKKMVARG